MIMPAISVVIPVYNAAPFLREALDSLLAQTYSDFEAIAVNDGSTDNSLEILQEYAAKDARIRILDGPNGGYGKAMNRGMDAAKGKYMAILEPDDYLPREAYSVLLPLAEDNQLDVVRGAHLSFYYEDGRKVYNYIFPKRRPSEVFSPLNDLPGVFEFGPYIWTGLYNLAFLRERQIRFHESPGASYQDTGFYFLCAAYAERYMITESVVYVYRTDNPKSSVNNLGAKRYMLIDEYAYVEEKLKTEPTLWSKIYKQFINNRFVGILWVCENLSSDEIPDYLRSVCEKIKDWSLKEVLPFSRLRYEHMLAHGSDYEDKQMKSYVEKIKMGGFMRVRLSEERTEYSILGIPCVSRRRIRVPRRLNDGIVAMADLANEYSILGIPLIRKKVDGYAIWQKEISVPAFFSSHETNS
ncbi:MAG: glycosyltransferase [Akkermansia sp.]|nr:glycosyltransferase [Akkermansia sp.]